MKIVNHATSTEPIDAVRPHPRNPRQGDIGAIHTSINANGFYGTIVAQRSTGFILAGNHRWQAARQANAKTIPVTWIDVDDEHAHRILLADNRTNDLATYDDNALTQLLQEIHANTGTLEGTGYDDDDLNDLLNDLKHQTETTQDQIPEPPTNPITEPGDLWLLGEHRLLCGDSTNPQDVERLMAGAKAEMMVTDPPYGVEYDPEWRVEIDNKKRAIGKVQNDDRADWTQAWQLFQGDVAYIWHADRHSPAVAKSLEETGLEIRYLIIWAKQRHTFGRGHYHHQHEPCWYAVRKNATASWAGDRTQTTLWQIDNNRKNETGHSTQKPIECMARPIRNHNFNSTYDPFLGSGTTLIAAEQLGRKCYGMEINPTYCDVTIKRWENLTGKKATLKR